MYDRDWARSVVVNFWKLRTRAQQINLCLQQVYRDSKGRDLTIKDIQNSLIDSVQGKSNEKLWRDYKRLVRKTPLDKELIDTVCRELFFKVDVEKLQRQFDFS